MKWFLFIKARRYLISYQGPRSWRVGEGARGSLTPQNAGNRIYGTRVFTSNFPGGENPLTPPPPTLPPPPNYSPVTPPPHPIASFAPRSLAIIHRSPHFTWTVSAITAITSRAATNVRALRVCTHCSYVAFVCFRACTLIDICNKIKKTGQLHVNKVESWTLCTSALVREWNRKMITGTEARF